MTGEPRCPDTGKIRYPSWKAATFRVIDHQKNGIKIYTVHACAACKGYHLTTTGRAHSKQRILPTGNKHRSKKNRR